MVAVPIALLLVALCAVLLPSEQRRRARQGAVLLGLSLACHALRFAFPRDATVERLLLFAGTFFLLASMARSAVLLVLDVIIGRRQARSTPRIFRDLSTATVYLLVGLVALRSIDVAPGSILTTSALLTAVVGLAMQDTLGNLVSGLALQMQPPFDVGDWIEIDAGNHAGRVTEVSWRATTIMSGDQVEVILPNASLAKAAIRNYSRPSKVSIRRVVVGVTYAAAPHEVHETLIEAVHDVPGVLASPAPSARTKNFGERAIEYEVLFFVDDFGRAGRIEGAVRDRLYYALSRQRLEIPYMQTLVATAPLDPAREREAEKAQYQKALSSVDLLGALPKDSIDLLAGRAQMRLYGPGEIIVRKGDPSGALYVIENGRVTVESPRGNLPPAEISELGPGQYFGELGLLTGQPLAASVRAKSVCRLVVVDHEPFTQLLAQHPEIVDRMGSMLASRQALLDSATLPPQAPDEAPELRSRRFISQIRDFFKLV
jgi:small-conductance mechanosensitive channel/CRP-like cAMP-binding protein